MINIRSYDVMSSLYDDIRLMTIFYDDGDDDDDDYGDDKTERL